MKISLKWLNQYVNVNDYFSRTEELAQVLTNAGLEVEEIEDRAKDFNNVVIAQILKKESHPDADKLTVCQVTTGEGRCHTIVCGAKNHNEGDLVVAALPGAVLPGDFKIKQSKIRGVESGGMLCSSTELGMDDDGSGGIMILPATATLGLSAAEHFGFDDVVFELKVTPNRADCLSHYGLAREISCLLGRECTVDSPLFRGESLPVVDGTSTQKEVSLEVSATDLCPRYAGRVIKGIKVSESPAWLKQRLQSVGINTINNIVDVTNYVMLELGQPLHAFDLRFLEGSKISVALSSQGEKFTTLDSTEIELTGEELVIRDGKKPVALAGVVGGLNSGVQDETCDIFVESAYFTPSTVRKTSKRFGIDTDSAYRFSRGVDPQMVDKALDRACELILQVSRQGEAYSEPYDNYPEPLKRESISLSAAQVSERLGFEVSAEQVQEDLKRVGCEIVSAQGDVMEVLPPMFRWDISMNMDLIEEVARLQGYDKIPETLPAMIGAPLAHDSAYVFQSRVTDCLVSLGYRQAVNYAFISSEFQAEVLGDVQGLCGTGLSVASEPVSLRNPLTEELNVMRTSLVPGLLKNLSFNNNYGNHHGRLFEVGTTFSKEDKGYKEFSRLAFAVWGAQGSIWQKSDEKGGSHPVVFELKSSIEKLLSLLGISSWVWNQDEESGPDFLHAGQRATLKVEGKKVGYLGTLHPRLKSEWKLRGDAAVAELDLDVLGLRQPRVSKTQRVSKLPAVKRDLSLLMPVDLPVADVVQVIGKAGGSTLKSVEVFDVYKGNDLEAGQRSVSFRVEYQDETGTLGEKRLLELQEALLAAVEKKFSIGIR